MHPLDALPSPAAACHLAQVVAVDDPLRLARVKVQLLTVDAESQAELWARVAVPFAGDGRGALLIPDVGDEVLVTFLGGDARFPIVLGSLWSGRDSPPEPITGSRVDRWTFTGKAGTRIALIEDAAGERIELQTPQGVRATLTDGSGGSIQLQDTSGNQLTLSSSGIKIEAASQVNVSASQVQVSAGLVTVDAAMATFSGMVRCSTLVTDSVVSASYTPGAGNVW